MALSEGVRSRKVEKELGIYELVKAVRKELDKIHKDYRLQKEAKFYLDSLDLELNVAISKATKAGLKFFVVTAGANYEKERISKIKLSFKPLALLPPEMREKLKSQLFMALLTREDLSELIKEKLKENQSSES